MSTKVKYKLSPEAIEGLLMMAYIEGSQAEKASDEKSHAQSKVVAQKYVEMIKEIQCTEESEPIAVFSERNLEGLLHIYKQTNP